MNYYLAKAKIIESEICDYRREPETVGHFLRRCPRWTEKPAKMWKTVERCTAELPFLLGGCDRQMYPDSGKWQPDMAAVATATRFVKDTDRFEEEAAKIAGRSKEEN